MYPTSAMLRGNSTPPFALKKKLDIKFSRFSAIERESFSRASATSTWSPGEALGALEDAAYGTRPRRSQLNKLLVCTPNILTRYACMHHTSSLFSLPVVASCNVQEAEKCTAPLHNGVFRFEGVSTSKLHGSAQ